LLGHSVAIDRDVPLREHGGYAGDAAAEVTQPGAGSAGRGRRKRRLD
jgi:hypothetical protein